MEGRLVEGPQLGRPVGYPDWGDRVLSERGRTVETVLLAWSVPLGLLALFLASYVPVVIYRAHHRLEGQVETGAVTLVGKFFHTFRPGDDTFQFQGEVLRESNGMLFVRLYDTMGDPSTQQFLSDEQVASARFYDTAEEWRGEGDRLNRQAARHH